MPTRTHEKYPTRRSSVNVIHNGHCEGKDEVEGHTGDGQNAAGHRKVGPFGENGPKNSSKNRSHGG